MFQEHLFHSLQLFNEQFYRLSFAYVQCELGYRPSVTSIQRLVSLLTDARFDRCEGIAQYIGVLGVFNLPLCCENDQKTHQNIELQRTNVVFNNKGESHIHLQHLAFV